MKSEIILPFEKGVDVIEKTDKEIKNDLREKVVLTFDKDLFSDLEVNENTLTLCKSEKLTNGSIKVSVELTDITDDDLVQAMEFIMYAHRKISWDINVFHEELLSEIKSEAK